jgi:hypothetical protein
LSILILLLAAFLDVGGLVWTLFIWQMLYYPVCRLHPLEVWILALVGWSSPRIYLHWLCCSVDKHGSNI